MLEIPTGWDGGTPEVSGKYLMDGHYLAVGRSTYSDLCRVWDTIIERSNQTGKPQIVAIVTQTHTLRNPEFAKECRDIFAYMRKNHGVPVTATGAKTIFDRS